MKRLYPTLLAAAALAAVCGVMMSATLGAGADFRGMLSRGLVAAALIGLAGAAALRPQYQRSGGGGVKGAVPQDQKRTCTFQNVAANEQALNSLMELKDYLKQPEKYVKYGARMPRGVLLYGPPGTGKTLLARALAGEAGVPFFALSGSDFVEKFVGVGASRVRELFKKARKAGRCVIFIDEIDAMGKKRDEASSDERDQTLNALLSEMSGFYTGDGVVVIAATNRIEMLDPALLRPGRFDRQIEVGLPGRSERLSILRLHGKNKPLSEGVSLERMAAQTVGFSGASLENLLNEAAILAAARDDGAIEKEDIDRAFRKTVAGEDRPSVASARERNVVAVHEAGHALVNRLLLPENRLARVSILPAAEQVVFGEAALTAGAANDIARATELAAAMMLELGLNGEPAVSVRVLQRQCGGTGDAADGCRALLRRLYDETGEMIGQNIRALDRLAERLLEAEALDGEEAEAVLDAALSNDRRESA